MEVSSEWLAVGHIDEIFLIIPNRNAGPGERTWIVLMASPTLAVQKLQEAVEAGAGEAPIFEGRVSSGWGGNQNYETTATEVLGDEDFMAYQDLAQARIDSIQQNLMDEMGLTGSGFSIGALFCTNMRTGAASTKPLRTTQVFKTLSWLIRSYLFPILRDPM